MPVNDPPFEFTDSFPTSADAHTARVPAGIRTADGLLAVLSEQLHFPDWFGFNWNALYDSLRDLEWLSASRIVLVHQDLPDLDPRSDRWQYLDILADAVRSWNTDPVRRLVVVFPAALEGAVRQALAGGISSRP